MDEPSSSTHGGSTRWMVPKLLLPPPGISFKRTSAPNIWALAVSRVRYAKPLNPFIAIPGSSDRQIWTEQSFSHICSDMGIIFGLSDLDSERGYRARPYQRRPSDKGGEPMPDWLWDLAQGCFKIEPSERPSVEVMADVLPVLNEEPVKEGSSHSPITGGSGTTKNRIRLRYLSAASLANVPEGRPNASFQHERQATPSLRDNFPTVHFGPVDVTGTPEEVFSTFFDGLLEVVRTSPSGSIL